MEMQIEFLETSDFANRHNWPKIEPGDIDRIEKETMRMTCRIEGEGSAINGRDECCGNNGGSCDDTEEERKNPPITVPVGSAIAERVEDEGSAIDGRDECCGNNGGSCDDSEEERKNPPIAVSLLDTSKSEAKAKWIGCKVFPKIGLKEFCHHADTKESYACNPNYCETNI